MAKKQRTSNRSSRSRKPSRPLTTPPSPPVTPPTDDEDDRPEFHAVQATVLNCTPGNYDHVDGERACIFTIAKKNGDIEPLVINLRDAQMLATKLLVVLATYDCKFSQKLLDDNFPADDEHNFVWPSLPHDRH